MPDYQKSVPKKRLDPGLKLSDEVVIFTKGSLKGLRHGNLSYIDKITFKLKETWK